VPLSGAAASALSPQEFADLMQAAGPFPDRPQLAVGLSGGPDSMVLAECAQAWAAARAGTLTALTVDHGLRPESASEARMVASWCADRHIAHEILVWQGDKPEKGIQAAARDARYGLLADGCRRNGCTELLVGHTENDQAETFLLRMSRGSGLDGLAAMPLVSFRDGLRLIRPLLTASRGRIAATVAARSLTPVTDPGNADRRYARVRLRQTVADLEFRGISARTIAGAARIFGNLRAARETAIGTLAQEIATVHPEGYAELARSALIAADPYIARGLVSALILAVGGQDYPPRRERLDRLMGHMLGATLFRPRTLGNCVIGLRREFFVIRREYRTIRHISPVIAGQCVIWDGRFEIIFRQNPATEKSGFELRALGESGWRDLVSTRIRGDFRRIPGPVRYALPAIWEDGQVVEVPHLGWRAKQIVENVVEIAQFRGQSVLSGRPFWVA
jgi:tRNA(Ile)-lysidine synthase